MASKTAQTKGLQFQRYYTSNDVSVFNQFEYDYRTSKIINADGSVVFLMENVEVPKKWSQIATDILAQKYFRKAGVPQVDGTTSRETSVKQVAHRLAQTWRAWGERSNYFATAEDAQIFYDELVYCILNQSCVPNSPQWFNTGLHEVYGITGKPQGHYYVDGKDGKLKKSTSAYERPQPHACFILGVNDDLVNEGGIMDLWIREARIFKYGSGVGTNFSHIRGNGEKLSGGGTSSGIMSFLKIGDRSAGAIKSGGTTRRAAKMVCLDLDHPEILEFINWKVEEEKKVAALVAAGYDNGYEGEAYATVSGQNSNNSIRIPNSFFTALENDEDWDLKARTDGRTMKKVPAKELWNQIAYAAWRSADPGTQYDDTINEWHTCPEGGRINASNPCVTADTFVTTDRGLERIGDLVGQARAVKSIDNKMHWVENIFPTGTKDIYELTTASGYTLKLTANHKVYTVNRGDVEAKDLTKDDVVMLVKGQFGTNNNADANLAQLAGLLAGDGCITNLNENDADGNQRRVAFLTMGKNEDDLLQWANDYINNDLRPILGEHNKAGNVQITETTNRVSVGSPKILSLLEQYVVLNEGSENKRFTDACFMLNQEAQAGLIRGLFTADGCVANYGSKSQYVALDSTSLTLLKQVQLMLLNFGIKAKIYTNRRAGKLNAVLPNGHGGVKTYDVLEMHSLRISKNSRILFEEYIGFMPQSRKAAQLQTLNQMVAAYSEHLTDGVKSLQFIGVEDVYDLTEPETSHFTANGIAVHNCSEYMFLDNTACNLASSNLMTFYNEKDNQFDVNGFEYVCRLWTVVLEISVLMAQFPSKEVAQLSYDYRTLGLGYANLGTMLMVMGIPYDSDKARGIAGSLTAIMTGVAYKTSAEMASFLGTFPQYEANKAHMMRVMRNHRLAAYDADEFEQLMVKPIGLKANDTPDYLLSAACKAWDDAVAYGEKYGYRNAQTTVIAPTGTIGLVMDCDTTGVEPDFALVKYKKLSGGGYFKIINQSVPVALGRLGYSQKEVDAIIKYAVGAKSLQGAPHINATSLSSKGFIAEEIQKIEDALQTAFDINFVFNKYTLGEECLQRLGFTADEYNKPEFSLLEALDYTDKQIEEANLFVIGTMTTEGAPYLKEEHYAIFDCAGKCGTIGKRYIHAHGHIRMMASCQPFLSGAISKTINLPNESSVEEIADCYLLSWQLGLKSNALYRDGSKLSQPLSNKSEKKEKDAATAEPLKLSELSVEELLEELNNRMQASEDTALKSQLARIVKRKTLPAKRHGFTQKATVGGQQIFLHTGEYSDGKLGEIFVDLAKEGSTLRSLMNCFSIAVSVGLQYGVPLDTFVEKFVFTRFEPAGMVDHPNIKTSTSIVDYIFRALGYEYLNRTDLVHVLNKPEIGNTGEEDGETPILIEKKPSETLSKAVPQPKPVAALKPATLVIEKAVAQVAPVMSGLEALNQQMKSAQSDSQSCNVCGAIMMRSGTCYKCLNCGNQGGCS